MKDAQKELASEFEEPAGAGGPECGPALRTGGDPEKPL
jgi:hypothetical protein